VTLGFGEIIRVFLNNLDHPVNITNGPKGLSQIDSITLGQVRRSASTINLGQAAGHRRSYTINSVTLYYYLFLALVVVSVIICHRLEVSRIGRAWMAIREDEIAAKAMGINTRNMKLLAFGMGATFGGVSGTMFAAFQGFVSPESFSLMESVMIVAMVVLGGIGHLPGVILGAVLLSALPEVLRWVSGVFDLQSLTGGRLDASILRQLLIALAMIIVMLLRPRGLWPTPEHGKALPPATRSRRTGHDRHVLRVAASPSASAGCRPCRTSASPSSAARSTA
jgi:branched-chain amino acid transport system permease protein